MADSIELEIKKIDKRLQKLKRLYSQDPENKKLRREIRSLELRLGLRTLRTVSVGPMLCSTIRKTMGASSIQRRLAVCVGAGNIWSLDQISIHVNGKSQGIAYIEDECQRKIFSVNFYREGSSIYENGGSPLITLPKEDLDYFLVLKTDEKSEKSHMFGVASFTLRGLDGTKLENNSINN